MDSSVKTIVMG